MYHGRTIRIFLAEYINIVNVKKLKELKLRWICEADALTESTESNLEKLADSKAGIPYIFKDNPKYVPKQLEFYETVEVTWSNISRGFLCYGNKKSIDRKSKDIRLFALGASGMINEYLIGIMVRKTLRKKKMPYYINFHDAFCTESKGYILMDRVNGSLVHTAPCAVHAWSPIGPTYKHLPN